MKSVLLVEDNDDHAMLAQIALSGPEKAFEVDRAKSAEECFVMIQKRNYDAIVLDYSLPRKSGLEVLKEIGKSLYSAPIVMVTSHGSEKVAVEAMKHGAFDYVSKSEDYLEKLPLVLQRAINARESEREKAELQAKIEESERRLRNIFESVEVGLVEIDSNHNITYANPKAKQYLNISEGPIPASLCIMLSGNKDPKNCANCIIDRCFETEEPINCEAEYNNRQFSVSITSLGKTEADVRKLVVVLMDITEQKRLLQQLMQSERIGVLGRMASGVAHKFNNLLAVILGQAELLLANPANKEEIEKGLRIIHQASIDGADTVRRLQEFTRVAKQKEFKKLKANDIVQDALSMTEPRWKDQIQYAGVKINVSAKLNSHATISGDEAGLRETIANIILNALDAMPDGGDLSLKTYDEEDAVCISISDTGVGIPPEIINNIFEPFFTTKNAGHAGLGLSIAYGTINRHGGKIDVDSIYGEGTTFIIRLPAYKEASQTVDKPATAPAISKKLRILVIDDEGMIRELLKNMLIHLKHEADTAADGIEGIKLFRSGEYDLVFTDLGMPGISGWEVVEGIKTIDPNAIITLITGWGIELNEEELKEKKADFVISKPFRIEQIAEMISKAVKLKEERSAS